MPGYDDAGNWSRNYSWVNDAASGVFINALKMDTEWATIAAGFNNALTRDGQGKPSGPINWNNQNLTAVNLLGVAGVATFGSQPQFQQGLGITVVKGSNQYLLQLQQADGTVVLSANSNSAYTGVGSGALGVLTSGAPRLTLGTNIPSGDDSGLLSCRAVGGASFFSHAFRTEDTVTSTAKSAYAGFDASFTVLGNQPWNHARGQQSRITYSSTGLADEINGFGVFNTMSAGTCSLAYGLHVADMVRSGGAAITGLQVGFYCEALTGAPGNFAVYAANNPNYLGGTLQISGQMYGVTAQAMTDQLTAKSVAATGGASSYPAGGSTFVFGAIGVSSLGGIQSYSDSAATPKALSINGGGGQVLVATTVPAGGGFALAVAGSVGPTTDNTAALGGASSRWSTVYAGTGAINTSDERHKNSIEAIPDEWLDAWGDVDWCRYKFNSGQRWHVGLVAQRVRDAFAAKNLDATEIGLLCYDAWKEEKTAHTERREVKPAEWSEEIRSPRYEPSPDPAITEPVRVEDLVIPPRLLAEAEHETFETGEYTVITKADDRWGLRYDECFVLEAAWQRRRMDRIEAKLASLAHD